MRLGYRLRCPECGAVRGAGFHSIARTCSAACEDAQNERRELRARLAASMRAEDDEDDGGDHGIAR